ncbi:hypothetical protein OEZ85_010464 [Tetradesmus obliquus]|uniref:Uncharacterized protein n=1 Tax=Tetradesmus obliquus TaxID=3088 RepID=A0ABY8TPP2_TETOB|nr:hypothetical protein OEZ85_010464 [Tetradesmus obliquus]
MAFKVLVLLLAGLGLASAASWITATDCSSAAPPTAFGPPTSDPKTTVSISTAATGAPDNGLCPGLMYNLKVVFPNSRKFIVAASKGTFAGSSATCPNRRMSSAGATSVGLQLTLPCDASGVTTITVSSIAVNTTSSSAYRKLTVDLPILSKSSACTMSTCNMPAAAATTTTVVTTSSSPTASTVTTTATPAESTTSSTASTATSTSSMGNQLTFDLSALFDANPLAGLGGLTTALQGFGIGSSGSASAIGNLTSLVNSLKTVGSVVNAVTGINAAGTTTTSASTTPTITATVPSLDPTQFLTALQQIGTLVNTGSSSGVLGLLTSLNTIQSAVSNNSSVAQISGVLNALKTVGSIFNPTVAASSSTTTGGSTTSSSTTGTSTTGSSVSTPVTATSPLQSIIAAGEDVVHKLQACLPASGTTSSGLAAINLPSLLAFVQSVGTFFNKLSVLNSALSG